MFTAHNIHRPMFIFLLFSLGLPIVATLMVAFAVHLLMYAIPSIDPQVTKTRTDIYSLRAAHTCFVVGVAIVAAWAVGLTALGVIAGIRLLR